MGKYSFIRSIEMHTEPETTLFQQEIDAILGILDKVCSELGKTPFRGTIILDGQKYGESAKCILKGNFQGGTYRRHFFRTIERTSDEMAAESIDEMLCCPLKDSRFWPQVSQGLRSIIGGHMVPPSRVYQDGELLVLILNATSGRFLCSIKAESADNEELCDEATWLLYVIAASFAQMGKEDAVLQESVKTIFTHKANFGITSAAAEVEELFAKRDIDALSAWYDWHEADNASGKLTLFFQ